MSEVMLARAQVAPEKVERLRAWFREMQEREPEVVETLKHEGVYTETAFFGSFDDVTYLYIYMEAQNLERADEAGDEEVYEIDEEHHDVLRDTLVREWEELDTIGHFTNPSLR